MLEQTPAPRSIMVKPDRRLITSSPAGSDPQARYSCPISLDLAPWRRGPKHWPVQASVPLVGSWALQTKVFKPTFQYSLSALRACPLAKPQLWKAFREGVTSAITALPESAPRGSSMLVSFEFAGASSRLTVIGLGVRLPRLLLVLLL